jgi:poly(A) polymerase
MISRRRIVDENELQDAVVLSRDEHSISRSLIDPDALKVMRRLINHGYKAYLVGGAVRDLLLKKKPKDFDIGTDARPEEVRRLFRNSRIIGKRFKLVHIFFPGKLFDISTFRRDDEDSSDDNLFGDSKSDALRRDLTINGLFYDLSNFSVIDFVGGIKDMEKKTIRIIGDPDKRFDEDPVRMLRVLRHAAKTGFKIDKATAESLSRKIDLIRSAAPARVYEELMRDLRGGAAREWFELCLKFGMAKILLQPLYELIEAGGAEIKSNILSCLEAFDEAVADGKELSAAVIFTALFFGNLSPELCRIKDTPIEVYRAFTYLPVLTIEDEDGDYEEGGRLKRPNKKVLLSFVDQLMRPVGVTKNEREKIPFMLLDRWTLLEQYYQQGGSTSLSGVRYLEDTLMLIKLTAVNNELKEFSEYLDSLYTRTKRTSVPSGPRFGGGGGRSGPPRRRRSGGAPPASKPPSGRPR